MTLPEDGSQNRFAKHYFSNCCVAIFVPIPTDQHVMSTNPLRLNHQHGLGAPVSKDRSHLSNSALTDYPTLRKEASFHTAEHLSVSFGRSVESVPYP